MFLRPAALLTPILSLLALLAGCAPATELRAPRIEHAPHSEHAAHIAAQPALAPSVAPAVEPGPIPDFAPLASVHTHRNLDQIAPHLQALLTRIAGPRHVIESAGDDDDTVIWMRDHQPLYVRRADGSLKVVAYLSENATRNELNTYDRSRDAEMGLADVYLPLLHENGNLLTNGRLVFVSERIFEDNGAETSEEALKLEGYEPRDGDGVVRLLAEALERPAADVIVLPRMPGEATGHVDVWMLFLDDHTVVVPEVREEAWIRTDGVDDQLLAEDVAQFLDAQAKTLANLGLTVHRLPMIAPLTVPALNEPESSGLFDTLYVSPANALLLHTAERADVILPSVDLQALAPKVRALQEGYEDEWSDFFDARGWTPWFTEATELVQYLGLVRCVTAPVPYR